VSALSFAIPITLSIVAAFTTAVLLPHPTTIAWRVVWWVGVLAVAWGAAILGERIARPLLPLASLLRMSLLFPDRAPSRFAVAWRSGSTRQLDRYVHGLDHSGHREPVKAAAEILTLVTALSSHDRRTRGHSERVRAYTDLIAEELRLPQPDCDRLRWSALLHDVGKISVDVNILNKAGSPSSAEWEVLHQHPIEGSRMIEPLREWLGEWGLAVEQHHENFDGTGYPYGISGDQISLGARIVAVADAFEVMTAARSYKSAMSPKLARKELTRCAGTQFDPAIVRAFLDISVGRQRLVIGPLAWLFDVPIVSQLSNLGNVITVGSQVALVTGSVTLGAAAAGGQVLMHSNEHPAAVVSAKTPHVLRSPATATSIVTNVSAASIVVGGELHASATISGSSAERGGTVTYSVFDNGSCSSNGGGLVASFGPLSVTNGDVPNSPTWLATAPAGTYYFVARYSGDADQKPAASPCGAAQVTLTSAVSTTTTTSLSGVTTTLPPATSPTTTTTAPPATTTTTTVPPPTTTTTDPPTTTTTKPPPSTTTTTTTAPPPTTTTTDPPTTTTTNPQCKWWWYAPGCPGHGNPHLSNHEVA